MTSDKKRSRRLLGRGIGKTPTPRPRNEFLWFLRAFAGALVVVAAIIVWVHMLLIGR